MRRPDNQSKTIAETLLALHRHFKSWQKLSVALGGEFSKAVWHDAATGRRPLPKQAEEHLRWRMNWPPKNQSRIWQWGAETMRRYLRERGEVRRW